MWSPKTAAKTTQSDWQIFAIGITSGVSFWGTLALNIQDFSRFAKNKKEQIIGQAISLPLTMILIVFVGASVTNAAGKFIENPSGNIANPEVLIAHMDSTVVMIVALFFLAIATISTNLAANIVSPANDLSNLSPRNISFKRGALIAATIGLLIMPWKLLAAGNYIFSWLLGYGSLLGAVGGIMIVDYFIIRRRTLVVDSLYKRHGEYTYSRGFNPIAIFALLLGVAPNIPGFLNSLTIIETTGFFNSIYSWGWFVSFITGGLSYWLGMNVWGKSAVPVISESEETKPRLIS